MKHIPSFASVFARTKTNETPNKRRMQNEREFNAIFVCLEDKMS